jgi:gamma-glutamyl-gamma-aminobutyraldehyde dehydrogenase/4-guanidinobutyraldehyde dehydrogenase/NAD-dependent aldehyde dehydrogenase
MNFDGRAFVNGERTGAIRGAVMDCISPIDGRILTQLARCDVQDVDAAVRVSRKAFDDGRWRSKTPAQRKRVLVRFADLLLQHSEVLAMTETLDMGKPIQYSRTVDVKGAAHCIRWYGEAIDKVYGEVAPTPDTALALITQEPIGVVGVIVPWNYPMLMAAWKIAPALATGNSVILKPSEKSPLTALMMADLALQAGVPAGVFNVLPGTGTEAGAPLALHSDVDCIAFTGSTRIGKQIHVMAGQSNLKRAWTELGGKSPNIVFADCPDLDQAVQTAVTSIFFNQGQSCNAPSRLLLEASIHDAFMEKALALIPQFTPANPLLPETVMGAIVDDQQTRTVLRYIESGKAEGAALVAGGEQVLQETGGYYIQPTIFTGVRPDMTIAREEIFGPVLAVQAFTHVAEAVQMANDSTYGLHAGVWTRDIHKAHSVARALRVGTVHVNQYDEDDITVPFGGFKQSGIGRDKSLHALSKYTETKTTWIRIDNLF